jgi:hypothetical protein
MDAFLFLECLLELKYAHFLRPESVKALTSLGSHGVIWLHGLVAGRGEPMILIEAFICSQLRLVANGWLWNKSLEQSLEVSNLDHFLFSWGVLNHWVELHNILGCWLPLSVELLLAHLDLNWSWLFWKLMVHNIGDMTSVWHLCIVLLLLIYVVMLFKQLL